MRALAAFWSQKLLPFVSHEVRLFAALIIDPFVPTEPRRICFVTRRNVPLNGNLRAVLDAMAESGEHEIGFFKEGPIPEATAECLRKQGVRVMQSFSWSNLVFILSSSTIVLSHSARDAYLARRKKGRTVVNVWHGVALKRIEGMMRSGECSLAARHRQRLIRRNARIYDAVIASNHVDRLVNALAFQVQLDKVHPTGLPRFDYLRNRSIWPDDIAADSKRLEDMLAGAKLVLYAPTFRDLPTGYDPLLSADALAKTKHLLQRNGAVLGIRPHPYRSKEVAEMCDGRTIINLSPDHFPEPAVILQRAAVLIVDYSSIWVDYLLLRRPILFYVPDLQEYTSQDRGFIHDYRRLFPGQLLENWDGVLATLPDLLTRGLSASETSKHESASRALLPEDFEERHFTEECSTMIRQLRKAAQSERTPWPSFCTPSAV
jgi:CDP-glycerol glycerophosphotransferase (TagB/SpsB family)